MICAPEFITKQNIKECVGILAKHISEIAFPVTSLLTLGFVIARQQQEVNSLHRWLLFTSSRPCTLVNCLGERNFLVDNSESSSKEKGWPLWQGLQTEGTNKVVCHWEGRFCTLLGLHWHPPDPYRSWLKYINEKKYIEWLLWFVWDFTVLATEPDQCCVTSTDVGTRYVGGNIPTEEVSRWSLEQIFKLYSVRTLY